MTPTEKQPLPWTRRDLGAVLLLFLSAFYVSGSLWLESAWFVSHEMMHQLVRLLEYDFAVRGGQFPVRWCDNLAAGYGYPFFNFYAPLSFSIAEGFHLLGFTLSAAWKAAITFSIGIGGIGLYGCLRRYAGRLGALAGGALYLFAPYHVVTLYVRGNLAELTALSVWPWAFWGIDAAIRSLPRWKTSITLPAAALAVAALTISHVLTAYMGAFNLVAWGILLLLLVWIEGSKPFAAPESTISDSTASALPTSRPSGTLRMLRQSRRPLAVLIGVAFFGAALSMFFWLPALLELRYCSHSLLYKFIPYENHYVGIRQFFLPTWGYGESIPGMGDTMSFQIGVALWMGVLGSILLVIRSRCRSIRFLVAAFLAMFFLHLFLMTRYSQFLWTIVPGASFLQFPWRLLIPATFWASLLGGLAVGKGMQSLDFTRRRNRIGAAVLLAIPAAFAAPYVHPLLYQTLPDYDPAVLRRIQTDTTAGEYYPIWVEEHPPVPSGWQIHWLTARGEAQPIRRDSVRYEFRIAVDRPGTLCMDVFWFPGWKVTVDGERIESIPVTPYGFVGWNLPPGEFDVEVTFGDTPLRRTANLISLTAFLLAIVWIGISIASRKSSTQPPAAVDSPDPS